MSPNQSPLPAGSSVTGRPWFTISISSFNRSRILQRCLDTCLSQSFTDFEVLVVDDGSTDDTQKMLSAVTDPRLRVLRHEVNRGLPAARDTGATGARGEWIVTLDSDHGLRPGALDNLHRRTRDAPADVGVVGSRYLWDTGRITPSSVPNGVIDYAGRIRWTEEEGGTDYLCCYRRSLYGDGVRWVAERRGPLDTIFQLDLAQRTKASVGDDVIALEYSDADNSQTRSSGLKGARTLMSYAADKAWEADEVIRKHGDALRKHGPRQYRLMKRAAAMFHFIDGDRRGGLRHAASYLRDEPASLLGWGIVVLGLLDRRLLAWVRSNRV